MIDWFRSIDGWTWVKVGCLMALAASAGLLKRKLDKDAEENQED